MVNTLYNLFNIYFCEQKRFDIIARALLNGHGYLNRAILESASPK